MEERKDVLFGRNNYWSDHFYSILVGDEGMKIKSFMTIEIKKPSLKTVILMILGLCMIGGGLAYTLFLRGRIETLESKKIVHFTPATPLTVETPEQKFDAKISENNLIEKCEKEAYKSFLKSKLPGYGYRSHWNSEMNVCFLDITGWDTEIPGLWNEILFDVAAQKDNASISIKNELVASGLQSRSENPAKNGELSICIIEEDQKCKSIEEFYVYAKQLMEGS